MSAKAPQISSAHCASPLERFYRLHSKFYDATRWSFLFGRTAILHEVAAVATPGHILAVGCGTGKNIVDLCRIFPDANVTGVDLSAAMLDIARRKTGIFGSRVQFVHTAYGAAFQPGSPYDLVLFSYSLSMFNPGFEVAINTAHRDLLPGGRIAAVDFHDTRVRVFERWMGVNHVRMNGQLRPILTAQFEPGTDTLRAAYGGAWRYLMFVGRKPGQTAQQVRRSEAGGSRLGGTA